MHVLVDEFEVIIHKKQKLRREEEIKVGVTSQFTGRLLSRTSVRGIGEGIGAMLRMSLSRNKTFRVVELGMDRLDRHRA